MSRLEKRGDDGALDVYQGICRYRCPDCGVEQEVAKPTRLLSRTSTAAWRKKFATELRRQILWEMCCPKCRDRWNKALIQVATVPEEVTRNEHIRAVA